MKTTKEWVKETIGKDSINFAAQKTNGEVNQATLNRQLATGRVSLETIISLAHAYKVSAATALKEVGALTDADLTLYERAVALNRFTDQEIVDEVARRIARGSKGFDEEIEPPTLSRDDITLAANDPDYPEDAGDEDEGRMATP